METIEVKIYSFGELSENAKEKAREWMREGFDGHWNDESLGSIQAFVDHFGASLRSWSIGPFCPIDYNVKFSNENFRGLKLKAFKRDNMPTGYCLDADLWQTFYDRFKATGDAKLAFDEAIYEGFKAWRDDLENQLTDEYIDEHIEANEYRFTENGKFWH